MGQQQQYDAQAEAAQRVASFLSTLGPAGVDNSSLQIMKAAEAEAFTQSVMAGERAAAAADHARRVAEHTATIRATLSIPDEDPTHRRGAKAAVVCLTRIDPATRKLAVYASATEAGRPYSQRADNIIQAIKRGGTCGGERWAYAGTVGGRQLQDCQRAALQRHRHERRRAQRSAGNVSRGRAAPYARGRGSLVLLRPDGVADFRAFPTPRKRGRPRSVLTTSELCASAR